MFTKMKTMFGKTSNQFDEIISTEKDPEQADVNEPIKLSKGTISLKAKEVGVLKVSVFNPGFVDYGELERTGEAYLAGTPQNKVIKPEFVIDNMKGCFEGATSKLIFSSQSKQLIPSRISKIVGLSFTPRVNTPDDFVCAICTRRIGGEIYGNPNPTPGGDPVANNPNPYGEGITTKYYPSGEQYCTSLRVIVKP